MNAKPQSVALPFVLLDERVVLRMLGSLVIMMNGFSSVVVERLAIEPIEIQERESSSRNITWAVVCHASVKGAMKGGQAMEEKKRKCPANLPRKPCQ